MSNEYPRKPGRRRVYAAGRVPVQVLLEPEVVAALDDLTVARARSRPQVITQLITTTPALLAAYRHLLRLAQFAAENWPEAMAAEFELAEVLPAAEAALKAAEGEGEIA